MSVILGQRGQSVSLEDKPQLICLIQGRMEGNRTVEIAKHFSTSQGIVHAFDTGMKISSLLSDSENFPTTLSGKN